ncbi:MAG: hypothetical protein QXU20_02340 [Candidatus Woesearchaeota archaeon]
MKENKKRFFNIIFLAIILTFLVFSFEKIFAKEVSIGCCVTPKGCFITEKNSCDVKYNIFYENTSCHQISDCQRGCCVVFKDDNEIEIIPRINESNWINKIYCDKQKEIIYVNNTLFLPLGNIIKEHNLSLNLSLNKICEIYFKYVIFGALKNYSTNHTEGFNFTNITENFTLLNIISNYNLSPIINQSEQNFCNNTYKNQTRLLKENFSIKIPAITPTNMVVLNNYLIINDFAKNCIHLVDVSEINNNKIEYKGCKEITYKLGAFSSSVKAKPQGLLVNNNNLYVADTENSRVVKCKIDDELSLSCAVNRFGVSIPETKNINSFLYEVEKSANGAFKPIPTALYKRDNEISAIVFRSSDKKMIKPESTGSVLTLSGINSAFVIGRV